MVEGGHQPGQQEPDATDASDCLDGLAEDLQQLRISAGMVSYAEIVRRIARARAEDGVAQEACQPARTTVYDAFKKGRSRINADLVGEIARALGEEPDRAAEWVRRCHVAQMQSERGALITSTSGPAEAVPAPAEETSSQQATSAGRGLPRTALVLLGCLAVNLTGQWAVKTLGLPLYLDMVGTAIAAIALGPWLGASVGAMTNIVGAALFGPMFLPFGLVNAAGGLAWGYGVRWKACDQTVPRYFALNVVVAVVCTIIAVPILLMTFEGSTGHAGDSVTRTLESLDLPLALAVLEANLYTSIMDKLVSGFVALAVVGAWLRSFDGPLLRVHSGHVDSAIGTPRGGTSPNSPRAGMQQG